MSCPANSSVMTSSRMWRLDSPSPSSSVASSSRLRMSSPRSPVVRRRSISAKISSSSRAARAHQPPVRRARARAAPAAGSRATRTRAPPRSRGRWSTSPRCVGVQAEQRAHRDPQRQHARPGVQVDRRRPARQPPTARATSSSIDRLRLGDLVAVERRQHDPARAAVELAVDRQQPVAEQRDHVARGGPRATRSSRHARRSCSGWPPGRA